MKTYDVAVIGAGPAGSASAYWLARRGFTVALLEKSTFPRDKACGDILSQAALRELSAMGLKEWLAGWAPQANWSGLFRTPGGRELPRKIRTREDGQLRWMTIPRFQLDARLASHAHQAGAELIERAQVSAITSEQPHQSLHVTGVTPPRLQANLVIVASGSRSRFTLGQPQLIALRGYYEGSDTVQLRMDLDRRVLPGYAWQFPVPNGGYNIGYGSRRETAQEIRLDKLLGESDLVRGKERQGSLKGGLINAGMRISPLHADRTLYVGDAAGLVLPHLAEGIYPALRSGRLAAEQAAAALTKGEFSGHQLSEYTSALHTAFNGEMRFSRLVHWILAHPTLVEALASLLLARHRQLRSLLAGQPRSESSTA